MPADAGNRRYTKCTPAIGSAAHASVVGDADNVAALRTLYARDDRTHRRVYKPEISMRAPIPERDAGSCDFNGRTYCRLVARKVPNHFREVVLSAKRGSPSGCYLPFAAFRLNEAPFLLNSFTHEKMNLSPRSTGAPRFIHLHYTK